MFRGGNQRAFTIAQNGRKVSGDHGFGDGGNFPIGIIEAGADKNKTCIHRSRPERQANR